MIIDAKKIKEQAKQNFEKAWIDTPLLIPKNTKIRIKKKKGSEHPLRREIQKLREMLLELGFDEAENLTLLPDTDVYRQYGPEAPVILDRAFYLAKLPRPDIGISGKELSKIQNLIGDFDHQALKDIFREYKKGEIEGDNLIETIVSKLKIKTEQATSILRIFPELSSLKPQPTNLTLRSHMTATWYHTLEAMQDKEKHPIMLFSIGPRYRNEQKEDSGHLRVHHSASIVILDQNMSLKAGKEITKKIFKKLGFKEIKFVVKKATSKYYANQLEEEVFVKHNQKWLEIADLGMYSLISLANFGIKYPVFNIGFGIERLVMAIEGYNDIRELAYPQFYKQTGFSDEEIAKSIYYIESPETEQGKQIAKSIRESIYKNRDKKAPVDITAWQGKIKNRDVKVSVIEDESGKKLTGPAAANRIFVKDGSIIGTDKSEGIKTGYDYLTGISNKAAYGIENKRSSFSFEIRMVRSLSDVNLAVPNNVLDYIKSNKKAIKTKGPVFVKIDVKMRG
ncbi:O-phosphoserine--tRNA ligase [Candidatus Woesearchaeota archaeon]|nr:O-phosphoserine--tRNA ligase [Candidatus Woesearchaeota archaeon]